MAIVVDCLAALLRHVLWESWDYNEGEFYFEHVFRDAVGCKLPKWAGENMPRFQKTFRSCIIKEKHEALKMELENTR